MRSRSLPAVSFSGLDGVKSRTTLCLRWELLHHPIWRHLMAVVSDAIRVWIESNSA
jgi:hypothetical protein